MPSKLITPEWVKSAVFYQIFPDRFAKSSRVQKPANLETWDSPPTVHGFKGGDLLGVLERLDYLVDLGINAIYFTPIFQSAANHRYHTHDYFRVDPLLGGDAVFMELLAESHRLGIRIVLDGVFNHASRGFFQFNHLLENGASSPYLDWFEVEAFPLNAYGSGTPNYRCWNNLRELPELNTRNSQVKEFIFTVARYWLEKGIDGWRLDVPFRIDDDSFWQEFRQVVKSANPDAYIVGEVPWEAQRWLQGDQFDAVMNYQFTQACLGFLGGKRIDRHYERGMMGLPPTPVLDASAFARRSEELLSLYPHQIAYAQLNLLDSHDMPRFINLVGGDWTSLRLAALFQMTYPGAPCIYYGDEIGLQNGPGRIPEDCRYSFPWETARWNVNLLDYYKICIAIRNTHPALRTGAYTVLKAEEDILIYSRCLDEDYLVIAINNGENAYPLDVSLQSRTGAKFAHCLLGQGTVKVDQGRLMGFDIPARSGEVFFIGM